MAQAASRTGRDKAFSWLWIEFVGVEHGNGACFRFALATAAEPAADGGLAPAAATRCRRPRGRGAGRSLWLQQALLTALLDMPFHGSLRGEFMEAGCAFPQVSCQARLFLMLFQVRSVDESGPTLGALVRPDSGMGHSMGIHAGPTDARESTRST